MVRNEKQKGLFDLRLQLQQLQTAEIVLLNRVSRYLGSYMDIAMYFLIVTDLFCDDLTDRLSMIPFGSSESVIASKLLKTRKWNTEALKYFVVRKTDIPESCIWDIIDDFIVMIVNNLNLRRHPDNELYHRQPAASGYASRGLDVFRVELVDMEDEIMRELVDGSNSGYVTHNCERESCNLAPALDSDKFMGISEYCFDCKENHNQKIKISNGKCWECRKCGERIYFANIAPETLFRLWRMKFLNHKK